MENKQSYSHLDEYYFPNIRVNIAIQLSQIIGSLLFGKIRLKIDLFILSSISKNSSFILFNIIIIYIFKYFCKILSTDSDKKMKRGFFYELLISIFVQRAKKSKVVKQKLLQIRNRA